MAKLLFTISLLLLSGTIYSQDLAVDIRELQPKNVQKYICGLYDRHKGEIIPCIYDDVQSYVEDSLYLVIKDGKYGIVNLQNEALVPIVYDNLRVTADRLLRAKKGDKWGVIDLSDRVLVPFEYDDCKAEYEFCNGITIFSKDNKWGVVTNDNKTVTPFVYDNIYSYRGFAAIVKGSLQGTLNKEGKVVVPPRYSDVLMKNGFVEVNKNGKYGLLDSQGKQLVPPLYDGMISLYADYDVFRVQKNSKWGLINSKGKVLLPAIYDDLKIEDKGQIILATKDHKMGVFDKTGKAIIPFVYDEQKPNTATLFDAEQDRYLLFRDNKWGVVDSQNKEILPFQYDIIYMKNHKGSLYFSVKKESLFGVLDKDGKEIIPVKYSFLAFQPEYSQYIKAQMYQRGSYGLISLDNKEVIPFRYAVLDYTYGQDEGVYKVKAYSGMGLVNAKDEAVVPLKYTDISFYGKGMYAAQEGEYRWHIGNYLDKTLDSKTYQRIKYISPNKLKVEMRK